LNRLRRVPHDRLVEIDDAFIEPAKLREPVEVLKELFECVNF